MLPAIPFGTDTNQMEFPLAMNLNPSTLGMVIRDIVDSLAKHKIYKLLILNSHGGNDFKPVLRELYGKTPVQRFLCDWYRGTSADVQPQIFEDAGDHAGEMETARFGGPHRQNRHLAKPLPQTPATSSFQKNKAASNH